MQFVTLIMLLTGNLDAGEVASLVFLWNPMGILSSGGLSTSPIDNFMVVISLYGACSGKIMTFAYAALI